MSDVKSFVALKKKANEALHGLDGGECVVARSGNFWSVGIRGEWGSVWGHYYIGHPQTVKEFCDDLSASWEAESWDNAHCS